MFTRSLRQLFRDRRRLLLASLSTIITVSLAGDTLPDPLVVPSETLALLGLIAAMPLVTLKAPKHRHMIEVTVLANVLFAVMGWAYPGSYYDLQAPGMNITLSGIAYAITFVVAREMLQGSWSDRFTPQHGIKLRARMRSYADPKALWYGLVPTPGQLDYNPDPEVVSIDYVDASRKTVRLITWMPPQKPGEALLHFDEIEPFHYAKLRMRVIRGPVDPATKGTTSFRLTDHGRYRELEITHEIKGMPPRRMLRGWLDDTLGRMMDTRLAVVEAGARRNPDMHSGPTFDSWYTERTEVSADPVDSAEGYRTAYGRRLSDQERAILRTGTR